MFVLCKIHVVSCFFTFRNCYCHPLGTSLFCIFHRAWSCISPLSSILRWKKIDPRILLSSSQHKSHWWWKSPLLPFLPSHCSQWRGSSLLMECLLPSSHMKLFPNFWTLLKKIDEDIIPLAMNWALPSSNF